MSRYQAIRRAKQAAPLAASSVVGPLVAGIVGGLAWAAGAEAWAWISPMRRRELEVQIDDPAREMYEEEIGMVDPDYEDREL